MAEGAQRRGMSPDDKRTWAMGCARLLDPEDYIHLAKPPRTKRRPSLINAIKAARKAGVDKGTVTVGDVSVTFGEPVPTEVNEWMVDIDKVTKQ